MAIRRSAVRFGPDGSNPVNFRKTGDNPVGVTFFGFGTSTNSAQSIESNPQDANFEVNSQDTDFEVLAKDTTFVAHDTTI